tara:strand:+ start:388 stop:609 length:222 start_codon:yes stop_codon:yes gene_type:complete
MTFLLNELKFSMDKCLDIAITLSDYSDELIDMMNENKEMAKVTIMHDFNGLFNHYGLKQADADFLPRLKINNQ